MQQPRQTGPPSTDRPQLVHCQSESHFHRRTLLQVGAAIGCAWLTPVAHYLSAQEATTRRQQPAKSIILLWLSGGPSQLETFDPHAGAKIAAGTAAIETRVSKVEFAAGLPHLAECADMLTVIRNVVSQEGDHERAVYNVKTGYRPDPTLRHPVTGAILCHQLADQTVEIPRHVSILPGQWSGWGGYLGHEYDAFRVSDATGGIHNVERRVSPERFERRLEDLAFLEGGSAGGAGGDASKESPTQAEPAPASQLRSVEQAVAMMTSEQLRAFDVSGEPTALRREFGENAFGDACLAALRLIEVGVRCVEVNLPGWDSHIDNHGIHERLVRQLDPAMAALLRNLRDRDRLRDTIVVCGGEFGRTPEMNPAGGRDHWPHGFSIALAGGGLRAGYVHGETDPQGSRVAFTSGTKVADIHATLLTALGIDSRTELDTPIGRPMKLSDGQPIRDLMA